MLFYEVKLIHPETKEVYFEKTGPSPEMPNPETMKAHQGAILVIRTTDSLLPRGETQKKPLDSSYGWKKTG